MDTKQLRSLRGLYLTLGIIISIFIIPVLGTVLNLFLGIFSLVIIVLSAIILVREAKVHQLRVGSYLALAGGVLSLIPTLMTYITIIQVVSSPAMNQLNGFAAGYEYGYSAGSQSPVSSIMLVIGMIAWVVLVISAVFAYINFSKTSKQIKTLEQPQSL